MLNPFVPRSDSSRIVKELEFKGDSVRNIYCEFFPIPNNDLDIVCSINGQLLDKDCWNVIPQPMDNVVFIPIPHGGGGGSNPVFIIASIALAAFAWWAGPALGAAMFPANAAAASLAGGLVSAGIMIGGGLLLNTLMPWPSVDQKSSIDESPTYAWNTFGNATAEGSHLPVMFGTRQIVPPLISSRVYSRNNDQYLYLLYSLCEGPVESIHDIEINNQPVKYYTDVETHKRLGDDDQELCLFTRVYADKPINAKLNKETYIVRETSGDGVDACQIHISCPMGLWHASDSGDLENATAVLSIDYKEVNDTTWYSIPSVSHSELYPFFAESSIYDVGEKITFFGLPEHGEWIGLKRFVCINLKLYVRYRIDDSYFYATMYSPLKTSLIYEGHEATLVKQLPPGSPLNGNPCWQEYTITEDDPVSLSISSNKASALYRTYTIEFPTRGQYQIRIIVASGPPEDNHKYGAKVVWDGLTEIINDPVTYPGVAMLGLRIKANDQLSGGLPNVSCTVSKNRATYPVAGTIDLTNPAWSSYSLLVNDVWGGGIPESRVILNEFQDWADFCDYLGVSSSLYLDQRMTYNDVKNIFGEVGRAQVVQKGMKFGVVVDKDSTVTQLFNVGNIIKDSFKMSYLPMDERANVIRISYYERDNDYTRTIVEVRDDSFLTANKEISQDITLYACDRQYVALKHGQLLMHYNKNLLRSVTFDVSFDSLACTIGDLIRIQHDAVKTCFGLGGRVLYCDNSSSIILDRPLELLVDTRYRIEARCRLNDEIFYLEFVAKTTNFEVGTIDGVVNTSPEYNFGNFTRIKNVKFSGASLSGMITPTPIARGDVYQLGTVTSQFTDFRITNITRSNDFNRRITASEYTPYETPNPIVLPYIVLNEVKWFDTYSGNMLEDIYTSDDTPFYLYSVNNHQIDFLNGIIPGSNGGEITYSDSGEYIFDTANGFDSQLGEVVVKDSFVVSNETYKARGKFPLKICGIDRSCLNDSAIYNKKIYVCGWGECNNEKFGIVAVLSVYGGVEKLKAIRHVNDLNDIGDSYSAYGMKRNHLIKKIHVEDDRIYVGGNYYQGVRDGSTTNDPIPFAMCFDLDLNLIWERLVGPFDNGTAYMNDMVVYHDRVWLAGAVKVTNNRPLIVGINTSDGSIDKVYKYSGFEYGEFHSITNVSINTLDDYEARLAMTGSTDVTVDSPICFALGMSSSNSFSGEGMMVVGVETGVAYLHTTYYMPDSATYNSADKCIVQYSVPRIIGESMDVMNPFPEPTYLPQMHYQGFVTAGSCHIGCSTFSGRILWYIEKTYDECTELHLEGETIYSFHNHGTLIVATNLRTGAVIKWMTINVDYPDPLSPSKFNSCTVNNGKIYITGTLGSGDIYEESTYNMFYFTHILDHNEWESGPLEGVYLNGINRNIPVTCNVGTGKPSAVSYEWTLTVNPHADGSIYQGEFIRIYDYYMTRLCLGIPDPFDNGLRKGKRPVYGGFTGIWANYSNYPEVINDIAATGCILDYYAPSVMATENGIDSINVCDNIYGSPPVYNDDFYTTNNFTVITGNVLENDIDIDSMKTLSVKRVKGNTSFVGQPLAGSKGGLFTINSDGSFTFDPNGDFDLIPYDSTLDSEIIFSVWDGKYEVLSKVTVSVTRIFQSDGTWEVMAIYSDGGYHISNITYEVE